MFEQELQLLLEKQWGTEERELLDKLVGNLLYYKKLIPKALKKDIMDALQMCNQLKLELEKYRAICKCNNITECSSQECSQQNCSENCKLDTCENCNTDCKDC